MTSAHAALSSRRNHKDTPIETGEMRWAVWPGPLGQLEVHLPMDRPGGGGSRDRPVAVLHEAAVVARDREGQGAAAALGWKAGRGVPADAAVGSCWPERGARPPPWTGCRSWRVGRRGQSTSLWPTGSHAGVSGHATPRLPTLAPRPPPDLRDPWLQPPLHEERRQDGRGCRHRLAGPSEGGLRADRAARALLPSACRQFQWVYPCGSSARTMLRASMS